MLLLLVFGLACIFVPGAIMAMCGLSAQMEEDAGLVWCFRVIGFIAVGIAAYFMFFR